MNVDDLRLPGDRSSQLKPDRKPPRPRPGKRFLKGPVPLDWLQLAAAQPGKVLHAAVYLWYTAGMTKSRRFGLPTAKLAGFGVTRFALYRALRALEKVGLISVERSRGRHPIITINNCPE